MKVEKPLWVPSAGCKGYWSKTNAALAAVIEQTCPGLSSKPPHLALQSLTKIVHSFFAEEETSSSPPEMKKCTRNRGSHTPTSMRNLRKKLRELRREWRQRCNEPSEDTVELRHEFHQTHKRIKRLASQLKSSEKNERLMKEAFKFRSNPYKYGRKVFNSKSTENPSFSAEEAEAFFPERFADTDRSYCYSPFSELPPPPSPELTSLRLRLRLMTSKRCSSRDETLRPLVQTASPTRCGNVASASIGRYTLSSAEFGAQLTFLRLGSVLQSVYSINRAQRKIHPTSAQLPHQTAKAKCFSRFSARQSCGTCSGTRFLTSASRRGFCLT